MIAASLVLAACSSQERLDPVPHGVSSTVGLPKTANIRFYPDTDGKGLAAESLATFAREKNAHGGSATVLGPAHFLALSGGGDDGAFGAGLLVGWSKSGKRPAFHIVTGVSTGALSAPFAFLGRDYDDKLREIYTRTEADDVYSKRSFFAAISDDAMADTAPLRAMVTRFVDERMVARIAQEYGKGRLLLIMTTNLDEGRPVIWNIGAIAASGNPNARQLIINILLASAAIPGAFPPVMLNVSVEGKSYQEMHVDGGAIAQAFLYPASVHLKELSAAAHVNRQRFAYVIRNGRLSSPYAAVNRQTLEIAGRAISTMIASNGINDTYRIYLIAQRDSVDFNLAYIDQDFAEPYKGPFDKAYMNSLFNYGFRLGRAGYQWRKTPPGYTP